MNTTATSAVLASEHTMGERLPDYVLPKIPLDLLTAARGRAWVYPNRSLAFLLGGDKRVGKRFNWRRPYFTLADGVLHCVVPPGQDYTHHYAELLRAACAMTDLPAEINVEQPVPGQGLAFVDPGSHETCPHTTWRSSATSNPSSPGHPPPAPTGTTTPASAGAPRASAAPPHSCWDASSASGVTSQGTWSPP